MLFSYVSFDRGYAGTNYSWPITHCIRAGPFSFLLAPFLQRSFHLFRGLRRCRFSHCHVGFILELQLRHVRRQLRQFGLPLLAQRWKSLQVRGFGVGFVEGFGGSAQRQKGFRGDPNVSLGSVDEGLQVE